MIKKIVVCLLTLVALSSCTSKEKIVYFQNIQSIGSEPQSYEPRIKADDLLLIFVSSPTPGAAAEFNLPAIGVIDKNSDMASGQIRFQTYLVNNMGEIEFPVLGKLKLGGLTKSQAVNMLKEKLSAYFANPIVNFRISNYKVTLAGEVTRPGAIPLVSERITLPEALAQAGDLTIYGDRKNILIVRDTDGVKTYNYVDITSVEFFKSDFYYLSQNDYIYVYPNQTKVNSSVVGPNITVGISALSLVLTIVALIIR